MRSGIFAVLLGGTLASSVAELPAAYPNVIELKGKVQGVLTGMTATVGENTIQISPGEAKINGASVTVPSTGTVEIRPTDVKSVQKEEVVIPANISVKWMPGGHLEACRTANMIPGALIADSVVATLPDGTALARDKDYVMDDRWAKLAWKAGGALTTDTKVVVDYKHSLLRIDGVDLRPDGTIAIVPGTPHLVCPKPPDVTSGSLRMLHVFRPYGSTTIEPWHVFTCGPAFPEPTLEEQTESSQGVTKTLEKLRAGQPVNIVTWGDSVTVGGDASKPELTYANLFISRLRERFPQATIKHVNAGIGGTNTDGRLPALDQEVLSHKPDLVTIEFVNDLSIPVESVEKNWNEALTRIKSAGAEAVVITPHFTMPEFMGNEYPRGVEMRPGIPLMRSIAAKHNVGLADTSRRWEHLDVEGIPYITLLYNGINHPDDRGHELFVKDLMNLFPK